jgi:hypothetical protein
MPGGDSTPKGGVRCDSRIEVVLGLLFCSPEDVHREEMLKEGEELATQGATEDVWDPLGGPEEHHHVNGRGC